MEGFFIFKEVQEDQPYPNGSRAYGFIIACQKKRPCHFRQRSVFIRELSGKGKNLVECVEQGVPIFSLNRIKRELEI